MYPCALFDECVREIEAAYSALGHQLGWRFLNVGRSVLGAPVKVALITINPAGSRSFKRTSNSYAVGRRLTPTLADNRVRSSGIVLAIKADAGRCLEAECNDPYYDSRRE